MILAKRLILIVVCTLVGLLNGYAVEVDNCVAGTLSLLVDDKDATELVVKGEIDARDLKFIASQLDALQTLDLSGAKIMPCKLTEPCFSDVCSYAENHLPDYCFIGKEYISVKLPAELSSIGEGAFAGCKQIKTIELPSTIISVGRYAFSGCDALDRVTLEANVKSVGDGAFMRCVGMKWVSLNRLSIDCEMGERVFADCVALDTVHLGASVKTIPAGTFSGCESLKALCYEHPSMLESVGEEAFASTSIPNFEMSYFSNLTTIGDWAFMGTNSSRIALSEGVTTIGEGAFFASGNLARVKLPSTVTEIGRYAFACDTALTSMSALSTEVPLLGEDVWFGVDQSAVTLGVPIDCVELYRAADQWCEFNIVGEASGVDNIVASFDCKAYFAGETLVINANRDIEMVELYDIKGMRCVMVSPQSVSASIDMSGYQSNVYVALMKFAGNITKTIKLIKQ